MGDIVVGSLQRDSFAGCDTSNRASPPPVGTAQMSPPDENAISDRSGEIAGSVKYGFSSVTGAVFAASGERPRTMIEAAASRTAGVTMAGIMHPRGA